MVLDTHAHAWGPPTPEHPWVNTRVAYDIDSYSVPPVYSADRLLTDMDEAGVDEAVFVGFPIYEWNDNQYTIEAVEEHDRLTGVVMLDPFRENAAGILERTMATDGILGFRLGGICPRDRMWQEIDLEATWLPSVLENEAFWDVARETDALVQMTVSVQQLAQALEVVEAYPDLDYVFDHFNMVDVDATPVDGAFSEFERFADYESVSIKVSNVPHRSNESFPYEDMHEYVAWLVDTFGRERVVWGSDWPNISNAATYAETLDWLDHVDQLSESDRNWIKGKAFRELYGL